MGKHHKITEFLWEGPETSLYPSSDVETKAYQGQWKGLTSRHLGSELAVEATFPDFQVNPLFEVIINVHGIRLLQLILKFMCMCMCHMTAVPGEASRRHQIP